MSVILSEAFKELELLSEDTFELNDEGIDKLKQFNDSDEKDDTVNIIDPDAESEEELEDSYVGKVILDCEVCHSKIYKNAEDVKVEDGSDLANVDEECPFCYTTDGYKVIGQVANYKPLDDVKVEVEDEDGNGQAEVKVKAEESFKSRKSHKGLKESFEYDYVELCCDACDCEWTDDLGGVESEDELYYLVSNGEVTCPECGSNEVSVVGIEGGEDYDFDESLTEAGEIKPVYKKPNGDYLVKGNGGYTAFNKNDACLGGISVTDEYIAIQCFKRNEFDESYKVDEAGNMSNYVDQRAQAGGGKVTGKERYNVYQTDINGRKLVASEVGIEEANKLRKRGYVGRGDGFVTVYSVEKDPYAKKNESVSEALDSVEIKADGQTYRIQAEPNEEVSGEEVITPISDETEAEITANEEGEAEVEVDEFSEEDFNELGESYLKEVYDNVQSYKTSNVTSKGNKLTVEGIITFNSGKQKKTQFVFEAKDITKRGKARFIGENKQICRGSKAFTLTGSIKSGKFLSESFNYNYRANGSKRVYGTIKRK